MGGSLLQPPVLIPGQARGIARRRCHIRNPRVRKPPPTHFHDFRAAGEGWGKERHLRCCSGSRWNGGKGARRRLPGAIKRAWCASKRPGGSPGAISAIRVSEMTKNNPDQAYFHYPGHFRPKWKNVSGKTPGIPPEFTGNCAYIIILPGTLVPQ